jgi:hypothetical protein
LEELIAKMADYGLLGLMAGALFWFLNRLQKNNDNLQKSLLEALSKNTLAFQELKAVIVSMREDTRELKSKLDKCHDIHSRDVK